MTMHAAEYEPKRTEMGAITAESLMSLEQYAKARKGFRERILAHKKNRTVQLGEHITLVFEDELTMRYQIQEMLRVERIFEEQGIRDELDAYNPLVPGRQQLESDHVDRVSGHR